MENPSLDKKKVVIISAVLLFIIVFLVSITTFVSRSKNNSAGSNDRQTDQKVFPPPNQVPLITPAAPFPKIQVSKWIEGKKLAEGASSAHIYNFKQGFSLDEANALVKIFMSEPKIKQKNDQLIAYSLGVPTENDISTFVANLRTGEFSYSSSVGVALPNSSTENVTPYTAVDAFVKTLILDPTLEITATYKKRSKPNVTYYEIHRSWKQAGLPILNAFGILNIPETTSLLSLAPGGRTERPTDPDIYQVSDGGEGLVREVDFNTMTIGVTTGTEGGKIVSLTSNIRQIDTSNLQTVNTISYEEAVSRLKQNKYEFFYTSPSGAGTPSFDKVYPGNKARADQATIRDSILTYVEKSPDERQNRLIPYYLFRGTAQLDSGYQVNFVATVLASADSKKQTKFEFIKSAFAQSALSPTTQPNTPGNNCQGGQCQSTYQVTPAPTVPVVTTQSPQVTAPQVTNPPQQPSGKCIPSTADLTNTRSISPSLNVAQLPASQEKRVRSSIGGGNARAGDWYAYSTNNKKLTADDISAALQAVPAKDRNPGNITGDQIIDQMTGQEACPVRITGKSPTLFVYGPLGSTISIIPGFTPSYSNPSLSQKKWQVTLRANGDLTANNETYSYLYYEHQKNTFTKPSEGWIVKKTELKQFTDRIAEKLALTVKEHERLEYELNFAASSEKSNDLFIGLIDRDEINTTLPLITIPQIPTSRLHFYIDKASQTKPNTPELQPIVRTSSLIVELGAIAN